MRTTLTIDDDVYETVQAMAKASGKRLGEVMSILVRRGLTPNNPPPPEDPEPNFPFRTFPATGKVIRTAEVQRFLEEEGP